MKTTAAIITLLASLAGIAVARAETVDLLLVLAADASGSIDDGEFNLQRKGYAAAMPDQAVAAGVTINGLAILSAQADPHYAFATQPPGELPKRVEENVIGGPGAFLLQDENFDTFAEAITRKLATEIAGAPPPSGYAALR